MSELYLPFKHVESPVRLKELSKLDPRCKVIQFDTPLTEYDFLTLADFLKNNPQIGLRIYGHREFGLEDLSFLRHFSFIKDFSVEVWKLKSFAGIEYLSDSLESLTIGTTERKKSVSFLANFASLKELYIEGHAKGIECIGRIASLERLTLRSLSLDNLNFLDSNDKLCWLAIKLGGTRNLANLSEYKKLKYLELWRINQFENLDFLENMIGLQFLFLQTLNRVKSLPSFKNLVSLRRLHLETMKGLTDISPICEAPILEELLVLDSPQFTSNDFLCLKECPNLKRTLIRLGSQKKNDAIENLLDLDVMEYGDKFDFV